MSRELPSSEQETEYVSFPLTKTLLLHLYKGFVFHEFLIVQVAGIDSEMDRTKSLLRTIACK